MTPAELEFRLELDAFGDASFGVSDVAVGAYLLYVPQFFPEVSFARWPPS